MYGHCRFFQRSLCGHCTVTVRSLYGHCAKLGKLPMRITCLPFFACDPLLAFMSVVFLVIVLFNFRLHSRRSSFGTSIPPRPPRRRSCLHIICCPLSFLTLNDRHTCCRQCAVVWRPHSLYHRRNRTVRLMDEILHHFDLSNFLPPSGGCTPRAPSL